MASEQVDLEYGERLAKQLIGWTSDEGTFEITGPAARDLGAFLENLMQPVTEAAKGAWTEADAAGVREMVAGMQKARPEVLAFAERMEARMKVGDKRGWTLGGWEDLPTEELKRTARTEAIAGLVDRAHANLDNALACHVFRKPERAADSLADAANLAMLAAKLVSGGTE